MPWIIASPEHYRPGYWICIVGRSLAYMMKNFNYLCHANVEEWQNIQIHVYISSEKFSMQRVINQFSQWGDFSGKQISKQFQVRLPCCMRISPTYVIWKYISKSTAKNSCAPHLVAMRVYTFPSTPTAAGGYAIRVLCQTDLRNARLYSESTTWK